MINDYWRISVFGIYYGLRIVLDFRMFLAQAMVTDYKAE